MLIPEALQASFDIFKPTEATSSDLELDFSLFTDWVITFEPLVS